MNDLDHEPSSSQIASQKSIKTGLTLRLPPLKSGKLVKKRKSTAPNSTDHVKIPRPAKLKPLREVLARLIAQIKKKDDYAFFLRPVDPRLVPGYTDVVQRPMDFGTMTTKVEKGKYRSLEDFASDFRLVLSNAKTFNIPGTIYHSEAERIETWGLDRITKAASTVIEYETDWNIEIEGDDDRSILNDDDDDHDLAITGQNEDALRSPSVASSQPQSNKRGTRATTLKKSTISISEGLEPDGSLPGAKDGLGAFPPRSDWANLMLALKLKGKKYRTKKERMRVEKSGPPIAPDGSLDYWEMEDPFTILEALVPEPPSRPLLRPPYPFGTDSSSLSPVHVSLKRKPVHVSPELIAPRPKRRHWSILRHTTRSRAKETDEEEIAPSQATPREFQATDFGSFSTLIGELVEERGIESCREETKLFDVLRSDLESHASMQMRAAERYILNLVYGGAEGLAYIRSLAEFVGTDSSEYKSTLNGLGVPLSKWVEGSVVGYITEGCHRLLRQAIDLLDEQDSFSTGMESASHSSQHYSRVQELAELLTGHIDPSCLVRDPQDLFQAAKEWLVAATDQERKQKLALTRERDLNTSNDIAMDAMEPLAFAIQGDQKERRDNEESKVDDAEIFEHVLNFTGRTLIDLLEKRDLDQKSSEDGEDPETRILRLNLLALAKRASENGRTWAEL